MPARAAAIVVAAALGATACGDGDLSDALVVTSIATPAGAGAGQAHLAADVDGTPVMSWLEPAQSGYALRHAALRDGTWSAPRTVTSGADLLVNWADFPSVTPITDDVWVAHWPALKPDTFGAYDVATAISRDSGSTWSEQSKLNLDDTETEHGFVTVFPWGRDVGIVWLDGRELAEWSFDDPEALLGVSLRYVRMRFDGEITERGVVDELVCDCCNTDVAVTPDGPVAIYRDRTEDEIRDVVVRRRAGAAWGEAQSLGAERWRIEGCPVNGPAVAARDAVLAAAWFTAGDGRGRVRFARSSDGGATFAAPLDVDTDGFGQVDVVLREDGTAIVSWWRPAEGGGIALVARAVSPEGAAGDVHTIALSEVSQPVDVPQMIAVDGDLLFAWTTLGDAGTVHTARVSGVR